MTLHTVDPAFNQRMMLGQVKLSVDLEVTVEADRRVLPRINNEPPATGRLDVFAGGAVTGLATRQTSPFHILFMKTGVGAAWKQSRNVAMAIGADLVADKCRTFNF